MAVHYIEKSNNNNNQHGVEILDKEKKRVTGRFAYRELTNPKSTFYLEFLKKGHVFKNERDDNSSDKDNLMYSTAHDVLTRWNEMNYYYSEKQELSQLIRLMNTE